MNHAPTHPAPIHSAQAQGVAYITLDRPEHGNTLTRAMMRDLAHAIHAAGADPETRLVLLQGRGADFCRGRDGSGENRSGLSTHEIWTQMMGAVLGVYEAIREAPVPVVSLVRGRATGFGAALAIACDVSLASEASELSLPEIEHGIPPTMALSAVLGKASPKALLWLVYSAQAISAQRALAAGLLSEVLAEQDFDAHSARFVEQLATRPRRVLETIKRYMGHAPELSARMASEYAGVLMAVARS